MLPPLILCYTTGATAKENNRLPFTVVAGKTKLSKTFSQRSPARKLAFLEKELNM